MSRRSDAKKRAFLRWELVRRNKKYIAAYFKSTQNKKDIIDPSVLSRTLREDFIKRFFVYPINPTYHYDDIVNTLIEINQIEKNKCAETSHIYEKYLGKNWRRIKCDLLFHTNSNTTKKETKGKTQKYASFLSKAKMEIKRKRIRKTNQHDFRMGRYLSEALHHLSLIKLSPNPDPYSNPTTVINSYLISNPNVEVYGGRLVDSNITSIDINPFIDVFKENLTEVCFEIDLSYPTKEIIEDIKKEVAKWKSVKRKYQPKKQTRQNLFLGDVKKMLQIYDLKGAGWTYSDIAKTIFKSNGADSIQR
ncbi:MAG: hypothetical protein ACOC2M_02595, partial [bacterium]